MEITSDLIYKIVKEVLKETEGRDSNASDFVKETDPSGVIRVQT